MVPVSKNFEAIKRFVSMVQEMDQIVASDTDDEIKYDLILSIAKELRDEGCGVDYYDPDTSYREDYMACYSAYAERAMQYRLAYGSSLD